jgi:glycerol-3-phosphate dehydrogenase
MTQNTGGPAFPTPEIHDKHPWGESPLCRHERAEQGMTLRDYFAAKALQGMLAENGGGATDNEQLAEWAYHLADAMLKARES